MAWWANQSAQGARNSKSRLISKYEDLRDKSSEGTRVAAVEAKSGCLPADRFELTNERACLRLIRAIGKDDVNAAPAQLCRCVATDAAAAAAYEGDFVLGSSHSFVFHECFCESADKIVTRERCRHSRKILLSAHLLEAARDELRRQRPVQPFGGRGAD